jgi:hypothetical protein
MEKLGKNQVLNVAQLKQSKRATNVSPVATINPQLKTRDTVLETSNPYP